MNEPETEGTNRTKSAQYVRETFTAEEYDYALRVLEDGDYDAPHTIMRESAAALRIAVNVTRHGNMQEIVSKCCRSDNDGRWADDIRKALLG